MGFAGAGYSFTPLFHFWFSGNTGVAARFAPAAVLVAAADLSGGRAGLDDRAMGFAGTGHTITFLSAEW